MLNARVKVQVSGIAVIRPLRTATRRSWQPGGFGDSCLPDGIFHGALDYRFVEVMPTPDDGLAVDVVTACRKNPLPTPLAGAAGAAPSPYRAGSCRGPQ